MSTDMDDINSINKRNKELDIQLAEKTSEYTKLKF